MITTRFGAIIPFDARGNGYKQRKAFNAAVAEYNRERAPGSYTTVDAHQLLPAAFSPDTISILLSGPDWDDLSDTTQRPGLAARVQDEIAKRKLQ